MGSQQCQETCFTGSVTKQPSHADDGPIAQPVTVSSDTAVSDDVGALLQYNQTMHYVYYLFMSNGQIYTGSTGDLKSRMVEHSRGNVTTTSKYLPVTLIGYEAYSLKSDAQRREKFMKTSEGKMLFRQQYRDVISNSGP